MNQSTPRVSRQSLARHPGIWLAQAMSLALVAPPTALLALDADSSAMLALAGALVVCSLPFFLTRPPRAGTWGSHLALACVYVLIGASEIVMGEEWVVPLGAAMFIATLTVIRAATPRQIAAHLVAAGICLIGPSFWVADDVAGVLTVVGVVASVATLTGCAYSLLRVAEGQGDKLQDLLRVDPLTGAGNQRLLNERLEAEIEVHARNRQPFSIVAADLSDFTGINERIGRERGDLLLTTAARLARTLSEPQDTVTRPVDDELWIVLPGADALAATQAASRLADGLASVATGDEVEPVLSAAFGIATYPRDGLDAGRLLDIAHQRLADDQQRTPAAHTSDDEEPAFPEAGDTSDDVSVRGLQRADLAIHPWLWKYTQATYAAIFALAAVTVAASSDSGPGEFTLLGLFGAVALAILLRRHPPAANSFAGDALLASSYGAIAVAFWLLDAANPVTLTGAVFIAPFLAVRTTSRHQLGSHLAAASVLLGLAALALWLGGGDVRGQLLLLALVTPAMWSLGISCMLALELAEAQGRRLEKLVEIDHVTGVGNRLMLERVLHEQADQAVAASGTLSVVVIELVETFENSRRTSEALLRDAAQALQTALGPGDTLTRRRGHEFAIVLPGAGPREADHATSAAFTALGGLAHRVECLYAAATLPDDAGSADELLRLADARLANGGHPVPVRQH